MTKRCMFRLPSDVAGMDGLLCGAVVIVGRLLLLLLCTSATMLVRRADGFRVDEVSLRFSKLAAVSC